MDDNRFNVGQQVFVIVLAIAFVGFALVGVWRVVEWLWGFL